MNLKHTALLLAFFFTQIAHSQKFTISGYISDSKTQEKLIGATVYDTRTRLGTSTNVYGFFSLTLPSDTVSLLVSYIGFAPQRKKFFLKEDKLININVLPDSELATIEVVASESENVEDRTRMSTINIPIEQMKKVPAMLGEVDVLKVLQLLPGVKNGGEGSAGVYVRGGGPDQNLILLDGAPIYNASHLFGFLSTFNSDAIKNVELIKGGFPARYGGRLSSVIDINMKEGNMRRYNIEGSVGVLAAKLMVEGPIIKDKTSFIISARRFYLDKIVVPIIRAKSDGKNSAGYFFYDLNVKLNHKFSDKDRIFLSLYNGLDKIYFSTKDKTGSDIGFNGYLRWGNTLGAARWNHLFNSRLFCNTSVTYTRYKFNVGSIVRDRTSNTKIASDYLSGISDWAAKINFDFVPSPKHYFKFGTHYTYHTFETGAQQYKTEGFIRNADSINGNPSVYAHELSAYIEDDWEINRKLKINVGLHAAGFLVQQNFYKSLQPRFSGRYILPGEWSLKASYASMMQFIHLLTNSGIGLPTDLWVPATKLIKPQRSYQVALGLAKTLKNKTYEISLEGYYKEMKDIIDYLEGANFIGQNTDWERKVAQGRGWSYGAELLLQKKKGKYTGWIGYTLSWTERQFTKINEGKTYPYKYDRRHDVSFVNQYKINNKVDAALTWVYGTGNSVSLPVQTYKSAVNPGELERDVQYFGSKNNYRMAPFHRLDVNLNYHKKKKWGQVTWSFGAYNVYSRRNPYFVYFSLDQNENKQLVQVSLFRIIPSINYSFKFDFRNFKKMNNDDDEQP